MKLNRSDRQASSNVTGKLDAQYEACAAYIASQKHEGWRQVPTRYDDGGVSGGTLERPAIRRLLADVDAGRIGMVVVYKIDRLTRSLADFAKLVDWLEAAGASFVSVTQSFNTSTSMGRLTLNVLLSFAQFEREVTAERIRDKIAASKKKGLWMGGTVPLGYDRHPDPQRRELVVNQTEARTVEAMFRLYDDLGCLRLVEAEAARRGYRTKQHQFSTGRSSGGGLPGRGQIHYLLTNPVYRGQIRHKDKVWPGQHPAIIEEALWNRVQTKLVAASQRPRGAAVDKKGCAAAKAILSGKLRDETGDRLTPSHTLKNGRRYTYYISNRLIRGRTDPTAWRVPAAELDTLVVDLLTAHLEGASRRHGVLTRPEAADAAKLSARVLDLVADLRQPTSDKVAFLLRSGTLARDRICFDLDPGSLAVRLGVAADDLRPELLHFSSSIQPRRRGVETRLVSGTRRPNTDRTILKTLSAAHRWTACMRKGSTIAEIAAQEGKDESYIRSRARLAFLSPALQTTVVQGTLPPWLTLDRMLRTGVPLDWDGQPEAFGIDS